MSRKALFLVMSHARLVEKFIILMYNKENSY